MGWRENICSQCPGCTSRAENKDWDSCAAPSFERTHSTVCSLKNSLYRDEACWELSYHLEGPSLSPSPFCSLIFSFSSSPVYPYFSPYFSQIEGEVIREKMVISLKGLLWLREHQWQNPQDQSDE